MEKKTTGTLTDILQRGGAACLDEYLKEQRESLFEEETPFSTWIREILKEKGLR
ncbi:MAG: hypothetical protein IJ100_09075 [Lachnospiraceae bacterium]|nr:hypothetical protein [Lachnospiraceae bacterium]